MQTIRKQFVIYVLAILLAPLGASALTVGSVGDSLTDEYWGPTPLIDISIFMGTGFGLGSGFNFGGSSDPCASAGIFSLSSILGDTFLGELLFGLIEINTDFPAVNWVQMLVELRGDELDWGDYDSDRGEPRGEGYENNWARVGATVLEPGFYQAPLYDQTSGILPAVPGLDVVFMGIGSNDFAGREMFGEPLCGGDFLDWQDELVDEMFYNVDRLLDAGATQIVMAQLPAGSAAGTSTLTLEAIASTNELILEEAALRGIPTFDFFAFMQEPGRVDAEGNLLIGEHAIPIDSTADLDMTVPIGTDGAGPCDSQGNCATLQYALNYIANDGLHPGSIVQGLIANEFLKTLNVAYGYDIPLLTDEEIIDLAAGSVLEPEPEPACGLLGIELFMALPVATAIKRARRRRRERSKVQA